MASPYVSAQWRQIRLDPRTFAVWYQLSVRQVAWEVSDHICCPLSLWRRVSHCKVWGEVIWFQCSLQILQAMNPCSMLLLNFARMKNRKKEKQTTKQQRNLVFSIFLFAFSFQEWNCFIKELLERNHTNFSSLFRKAEQQCDWSEEWDCNLAGLTATESSSISLSPLCSFHSVQSFTYFTSPPALISCQESPKRRLSCQASNFKWVLEAVF